MQKNFFFLLCLLVNFSISACKPVSDLVLREEKLEELDLVKVEMGFRLPEGFSISLYVDDLDNASARFKL